MNQSTPDKEIDLLEIVRAGWTYKWLVAVAVAVGMGLAFLYAQQRPAQSTLEIYPPSETDLAILNRGRVDHTEPVNLRGRNQAININISGLDSQPNGNLIFSPASAYHEYLQTLISAGFQQVFFEAHVRANNASASFSQFHNSVGLVKLGSQTGTVTYGLQHLDTSPENSEQLLTAYADMANNLVSDELKSRALASLDERLSALAIEAELLQSSAVPLPDTSVRDAVERQRLFYEEVRKQLAGAEVRLFSHAPVVLVRQPGKLLSILAAGGLGGAFAGLLLGYALTVRRRMAAGR